MNIKTSCPTRIDLAGGTLDIYPLYIFENGGITVNCALNLRSYVELQERKDKKIHIYSSDLKIKEVAKNIHQLNLKGKLGFLSRIVKFYKPKSGLNIITKNTVPKGSGLGASSSLLISLSCALNQLREKTWTKKQIIDIGANLEAQAIEIPTGKQDYYSAMFGGINAIWFNLDGNKIEKLIVQESLLKILEERIILTFTGISHFSAVNNWQMLKRYIDKRGNTINNMRRIKETALKMRECLLKADLDKLGILINEEWENRKKLAKGVSNPYINKLMETALKNGALANKLCGAGGGGCMITFVREGKREKVISAFQKSKVQILPFKIAPKGVLIRKE